ncbi:hypothetical protein HET73_02625 [Wolbachia endosymbiont of Atemnus politus]|uniref:hypothetical protein n=1 Tax=Wolbachia endosymbiont of Atemnus politus TaxID=2682840 RepID=UPI00157261A2|nr:hypothetical protein [Wolbachia endosymbiont of Atemnus politus]NSM56459.1 hypothetical protein [Wolbachia endosymbiont of Atemnus politus]
MANIAPIAASTTANLVGPKTNIKAMEKRVGRKILRRNVDTISPLLSGGSSSFSFPPKKGILSVIPLMKEPEMFLGSTFIPSGHPRSFMSEYLASVPRISTIRSLTTSFILLFSKFSLLARFFSLISLNTESKN